MSGSSGGGCCEVNIAFLAGTFAVPGSVTEDDIVTWGASNAILKDSGVLISTVVVGPASATDNVFALYNGTTGKLIKNSTFTSAQAATLTGAGNADALHIHSATGISNFDEAAQDAVGGMLLDSATIDFTYTDATPSLTAIVIAGSLTNTHINASAAIAYSKLALTGSIVNADVASAAAIAFSKMAAMTSSSPVVTDGSGFVTTTSYAILSTNIIHDSTSGFSPNRHIDHTGVTITAGAGLSGGGTIASSFTIDVNINAETLVVPALTDELLIADASDTYNIKKITLSTLIGAASSPLTTKGDLYTHDGSVNARQPVGTNGYLLSANSAQTNGLEWIAPVVGYTTENAQDDIGGILVDSSSIDFTYSDATPSITAVVLPAGVNHNLLLNYVANEHINHTSVTLTAGTGLSGGGDISANRTFNLDLNDLTTDTPVVTDTIAFYDVSGTDTNKATISTLFGLYTELWDRADTALVWPDGSGTHASIDAAVADTAVNVIFLMPDQSGVSLFHQVANPLSITRPIALIGQATEGFVDVRGNVAGSNLFNVSGSGSLDAMSVSFGSCSTAIANTGGGRITVRHCEFDGLTTMTTAISTTSAASDIVVQHTLFLFVSSTVILITNCDTFVAEGNSFVLNSGANVRIDNYATVATVSGNNFFGGSPQLDVNGGSTTANIFLISRSNTYQSPGALGGINLNGTAANNFESQGDVFLGGAAGTHVIIDAANLTVYNFRTTSLKLTGITRGANQRRLQNFVDENAGLYSSTLKAFTDSNNNATVTIATNSNSLGAIISGLGTKVYTLNPTAGQAISSGAITATTGQTGTINFSPAKGGVNFGNVDLSGASAITGSISDTAGTYNTNLGSVVGTTSVNGSITFAGKYSVNAGSVVDGGTISIGSAALGVTQAGLITSSGAATITGNGSASFVYISGSGSSATAGASGKFGFVGGAVVSTTTTTNSIEATGQGTVTIAVIDKTTATAGGTGAVTGTNFYKTTGNGCFHGGYSSYTDGESAAGPYVINHQSTTSGNGCFTWVNMRGVVGVEEIPSTSTITVTNSGTASAIIGEAIVSGSGVTTSSMVATQNASIIFGRSVSGTISNTAAAAFILAATQPGITISCSQTGASIIGAAATHAMTASGLGARARGYATGAAIVASATNSNQTGPGTNATADSSQFGVAGAGIMLHHTTGNPAQNGALRVNSTGTLRNQSNGVLYIVGTPYVAKTANYTLVSADDHTVDATTNSFTFTLPTAVGVQGKIFNLKNSGTGTTTVATTSSQTIDGALTLTLTQYQCATVQSNNANWIILSRY